MKILVYIFICVLHILVPCKAQVTVINPCAKVINPLEPYSTCVDSCKIAACDVDGTKIAEKSCPSNAPYCRANSDKTGYCSSHGTATVSCPTSQGSFKCTSFGIFPDPYDCTLSYFCSKIYGSNPVPRRCRANEVFREDTEKCDINSTCVTVDCRSTVGNGIFSKYGNGYKYYAACTTSTGNGSTDSIKMYRCADGAYFDSSSSVSKCVYRCNEGEGYYPYSLDSTKYYDCEKYSTFAKLKQCEFPGSIFIVSQRHCGYNVRKV